MCLDIAVPSELLPLWRPGRDASYYDSCIPLVDAGGQSVVTRPGNRVLRAMRGSETTIVKAFPARSSEGLRTCLREARLLHRLRHPAVVEILSVFQLEHLGTRSLCVEMPFYENGQLDTWVEREQPGAGALRNVILQVLRAVGHMHANGVVHRDIKPASGTL